MPGPTEGSLAVSSAGFTVSPKFVLVPTSATTAGSAPKSLAHFSATLASFLSSQNFAFSLAPSTPPLALIAFIAAATPALFWATNDAVWPAWIDAIVMVLSEPEAAFTWA